MQEIISYSNCIRNHFRYLTRCVIERKISQRTSSVAFLKGSSVQVLDLINLKVWAAALHGRSKAGFFCVAC